MEAPLDRVRDDFDRIALLPADRWSHSAWHHEFLLSHLPPRVGSALDVGCGTGDLSRLLAARADRVRALDLSANMIRVAKGRCASSPNIDFEIADVMTCALEPASFDCIASIATLHHLPMQPVLERLRDALRPGGVLMVLDLFTPASVADRLAWAASYPLNVLIRLRHGYRPPSRDARKVWNEHGRRDVYPRLRDVRALCAAYLPGADVRRHLLWRYSIVWRKPGVSGTG